MAAQIDTRRDTAVAPSRPKKPGFFLSLLGRLLLLPVFLVSRKKAGQVSKAELDHELRLFSQMFPTGFLHYGYFDDTRIEAERISFGDLDRAQQKYADRLIAHARDTDSPVLDVGCGMGGISFMLLERGYEVVSLTPDRHQAAHIRECEPDLRVIESTFEAFEPQAEELGTYGTILTSESLQYLDLDKSLPKIRALLKPDGVWIACDYFRLGEGDRSSGHVWNEFCETLRSHGFEIRSQEDITDHILPSLRFATLMAERFILPAWNFVEGKLASKAPGIHYLLEDVINHLDGKVEKGKLTIDPDNFKSRKRYLSMVIEQSATR